MLSENAVMAWVGQKVESAINDEDGDLSDRRQTLLNYYRGEPYGNERKGYSKIVTREAFETVEWAMPLVLKALTAEDATMYFDPQNEGDVEAAEQETAYCRHIIMKKNKGFLELHQWLKDALMYPNGYLKVYPEKKLKRKLKEYKGLTMEQAKIVSSGEYVDVIGRSEPYTKQVEDELGNPIEIQCIDIKLRCREETQQIRIEAIPPEQVLIDDQVRSIDIDRANFVSHRVKRSKTELLDMGFDGDKLERVGSSQDYTWNDETVNRLFHEDENPEDGEEESGAMQNFWLHESYGWLDYDEDGVAEYRRIVTVGGTVFENEEIDYQPMIALSSILMSHQHAGISLIEAVDDLQLIMSTLWRNVLNNIYRINTPRKYVNEQALLEDGSTYDAMMDAQAEIIPVRGDPNAATKQEVIPSLVGEILPAAQALDDRVATRTGIAPNISLDPANMQQSTMGAFMGALEKANERLDMLIRVFAETGMRPLLQKTHYCVRHYQDVAGVFKMRGNWVDVDPQAWEEREDMTVNVGLGFNSKSQMLQILMGLLDLQKEALPTGMADMPKLYKTLEKLLDTVGLNAFEFFNDPSSPDFQAPQPQPDPMIELAKADLEQKAQGQQIDAQKAQAEEQRKTQEMYLKYGDMQAQLAKLMEEIENLRADRGLTEAQRLKVLADADAQDTETALLQSGVRELLAG